MHAPNLDIKIDPTHPSAAHIVWDELLPEQPRPVFFDMVAKMDIALNLKQKTITPRLLSLIPKE